MDREFVIYNRRRRRGEQLRLRPRRRWQRRPRRRRRRLESSACRVVRQRPHPHHRLLRSSSRRSGLRCSLLIIRGSHIVGESLHDTWNAKSRPHRMPGTTQVRVPHASSTRVVSILFMWLMGQAGIQATTSTAWWIVPATWALRCAPSRRRVLAA